MTPSIIENKIFEIHDLMNKKQKNIPNTKYRHDIDRYERASWQKSRTLHNSEITIWKLHMSRLNTTHS